MQIVQITGKKKRGQFSPVKWGLFGRNIQSGELCLQINMRAFIPIFLTIFSSAVSQVHTPQELEFIKETNILRTDPKNYILIVKEYLKHYGTPGEKVIAEREVFPLLIRTKPISALKPSEECRSLMMNHGGIDTLTGDIYHDLSWMTNHYYSMAENLVTGSQNAQRMSVIRLLIDEGVPSRGHRISLLNPAYTHTSVRFVKFGKETDTFARAWWIQVFFKF